jgi:hypothetical protein
MIRSDLNRYNAQENCHDRNNSLLLSQKTFIYTALRPADQTRILVLEPGSFGNELRGSIQHVSDLRGCQYDCLSYFWGKKKSGSTIIITSKSHSESKSLSISPNLHAALQRLRSQHEQRSLWVDAICINQNDNEEKASQVGNMRVIFASAAQVVVWLGEEEEHDSLAMCALQRINLFVHQWDLTDPIPTLGFSRDVNGDAWSKGTKALTLPVFEESSLQILLHRDWFRRSWTVQEVATAQRVVVQYGDKIVPWEIFNGLYHKTLDRLSKEDLDSDVARLACESIATMENGRRSHPSLKSMELFNILLATNRNDCEDKRDKVFSMLGIAHDWLQKRGLEPDYSSNTTVEDVFKRFARWDTKSTGKIRILSCGSGPFKGRGYNLPSWVPDWTDINDSEPFVRYSDRTGFSASLSLQPILWHSDDDNTMHIAGQVVDVVSSIGKLPNFSKVTGKFALNSDALGRLVASRKWIRDCYAIAKRTFGTMKGENFDVFAATMLCGLTGEGFPISDIYLTHFSD